jgi:type IV secretion system protein VirB10
LRKAQREQQAAQAAEVARQLADAARKSSIIVSTGSGGAAAAGAADARSAPLTPASAASPAATPATVADANAGTATDPTTASQRAKNEFLSLQKSTTASDYLTTPRQAAISPYEVQAGSIIPAILVTGINSDLPGQMIGQVSQNVYDSKTGTYLLIPAGSKLVGRYDSQVSNGQSRVLVAWQRIIFPDSSFIDINGMSGTDTAGYTGLTGKVDDHSGKLFRNAILSSLIGVGGALLQPRTALTALTPVGAVVTTPSVGSQVAGQVGTQVAQVAQQVGTQGVQQAPTIEVRPGYLFNILVDRDLVLPGPYTK